MKKYKVGILGATGMVGQRFITLLNGHPWFDVSVVAASSKSAKRTYENAVKNKWVMPGPIPSGVKNFTVYDAVKDMKQIVGSVDFVFCALNISKEETVYLEESYARFECPVISNNSANRMVKDIPMILPEINPEHVSVIETQKRRLGTKRGFIAVKPNCSLQCYVPALFPLLNFGLEEVKVCTYQAISGAGKTFATFPEILDNVIPYIAGEEEKSETEPLKIFGTINANGIKSANKPRISAQCFRVPVTDGHTAGVFAKFRNRIDKNTIIESWLKYKNPIKNLNLPSAPYVFLKYFEEPDRPQVKLDKDLEKGMGVSVGKLRADEGGNVKFVGVSHNTVRGAAGGAILLAELLCSKGYI